MARRPTISQRVNEHKTAMWLLACGWWACDEGFRHPNLAFPWPLTMAARLQSEAHSGCKCLTCSMLLGRAA